MQGQNQKELSKTNVAKGKEHQKSYCTYVQYLQEDLEKDC